MAGKKWVIGLTGFLLVTLLFVGYIAIAAESGSRDDPLVTASYITDELMPNLNKKFDEIISAKTDKFTQDMNKQYDQLMADLDAAIKKAGGSLTGNLNDPAFIASVADAVIAKQGGLPGGTGGTAATMTRVDVQKGKTVTLALGSEVVLRLGSANCVATGTPGLIDTTDASELAGGGSLKKNHVYLSTVEGRGFRATADTTVVFIRGSYTVN